MSVAQFLPVGGDPTEMTIAAFQQAQGEWQDCFLVTYDDNVTSQNMYFYLSEEMIKNYDLGDVEAGWYFADGEGMPDFEKGPQTPSLPYTRGCVICGSALDGVQINSCGEVSSDYYEIVIPNGARRMTGNVLPRTIDISEIKQVGGEWQDCFFVTYDDNVTSQNMYFYLSEEMIKNYDLGDVEAGWYFADGEGMPDFEKGPQSETFAPGAGFVINSSALDGVTIRFPKAM